MKKCIYFIIVQLLFVPFVRAQNIYLLDELQNKFNSIHDFSADFVQLTNGKVNLDGKLFFKKENSLRLELKNLIIVSDGITNWNYNKKQKKVIISNYDENDPSVLSLKRIIFDYPSKCDVSEDLKNGEKLLLLKPRTNSGINADMIKLWVGKDYNIEKVSISESSGNVLEVQFSNYKINAGISNSKFSFTPPEGTKIIDLR